jgi:hypothetical protein
VQTYKRVLFFLAISIVLFIPALIKGIPSSNDLPHHYRVVTSFAEAIRSGVYYPNWNSLSTGGYGDVSFRFYPPGAYFFVTFAGALTGDWFYGSLLAFVMFAAVGGFGVYFWAKDFLSPNLSSLAGVLYIIAPFHVNEIYQAFLMPEYAGSAILPFCFAFVTRVCRDGRKRDVAGLAATYGLLVLTHLPLAVIASFAFVGYAILLIRRDSAVRTVLQLSAAALLGLLASARYWMMMVSEFHWLKSWTMDWYDYQYNFVFGKTVEGSTSWWANVLAVITVLFFLPGFIFLYRRSHDRSPTTLRRVALLAIVSFVMATPISKPLWMILPGLKEVQFPWRWLVVTSMAGAMVLAASMEFWLDKFRGKRRPLALVAAGCLLVPCGVTVSQTIRGATFIPRARFESITSTIASTESISYWRPTWAAESIRPMNEPLELINRSTSNIDWGYTTRSFEVEAGPEQEARIRTFYYPHWIASAEGVRLQTRPSDDGALLISIPDRRLRVELEFVEPRLIKVAGFISLVAWLLIGGMGLRSVRLRLFSSKISLVRSGDAAESVRRT